jgi:spore coat protein U-like protein
MHPIPSATSACSPTLRRRVALIGAATSFILIATTSWAGTTTETGGLAVSARIVNQCAVGDAALSLGAITLVNTNGTMATLSGGSAVGIPWGCTTGTAATLSFGLGDNTNGSARRMLSNGAGTSNQYLEYQLKADSSSGPAIGTSAVTLVGADGSNKTFTVWGGPVDSVANRAAKPGSYTDAVLLTITFAP